MATKRAVIYIRLSAWRGDGDPSTSPERQREVCTAYAAAKGWQVVDVVEDLDVSGSARGLRLDRPGLRRVRDAYDSVDVVIFSKLDRLARNVRDFAAIAEEAQSHGVALVSVAESLDLSTAPGRFVATILAAFAEMEAETIAERTAAGRAEARRQGRWTGGTVPFGYRVIDNPDGNGRVLDVDPAEATILREMVTRYLDGAGGPSLAQWLNAEHGPRYGDRPWRGGAVRRILGDHAKASDVLTGPVRLALAAEIERRTRTVPAGPRNAHSLLTGLLKCATCGSGVVRDGESRRQRPVYRCNHSGVVKAEHARVNAEEAEALVSQTFLDDHGAYKPGVRVIPSAAYDLDVVAATDAVEALSAALATAKRADRLAAMQALNDAEDALQDLLDNPPARTPVFTSGELTIEELWTAAEPLERRDMLKQWLGTVLCGPARDDEGRIQTTEERLTFPRIDDPEPEPVNVLV